MLVNGQEFDIHHPKGDLMKTANIALGKEPALELED